LDENSPRRPVSSPWSCMVPCQCEAGRPFAIYGN
jgi:hypothetical protein